MTLHIKFCLIALLVVFGSLFSRANDNKYLLSLSYIDDGGNPKTSYVKLTDKPVISMAANQLEISVLNVSLQYDNVTSINFVDESSTAIGKIKDTKIDCPKIISFDGSYLKIAGISANSLVYVYTLDGKMLLREHVGKDGSASIAFSNIQKGTFIVKTNTKSFKISKK